MEIYGVGVRSCVTVVCGGCDVMVWYGVEWCMVRGKGVM